MKNAIIANFDAFNCRRYSAPWVCTVDANGKYDFSARVGTYSANGRAGEPGDLVVFEPTIGTVYAYGQKDYRGNNTKNICAKWDGEKFVLCDKLGREKD